MLWAWAVGQAVKLGQGPLVLASEESCDIMAASYSKESDPGILITRHAVGWERRPLVGTHMSLRAFLSRDILFGGSEDS